MSPVVSGSGVEIVHRMLAERIPGYRLAVVGPRTALLGPFLPRDVAYEDGLIHTIPDLGGYMQAVNSPSLVTFHNFMLDDFALRQASRPQRIFYRSVLAHYIARAVKRATIVTAVSRFTAGLVRDYFGVKAEVVNNGVDSARFAPASDSQERGRPRVLFVGNMSARKGRETLGMLADELADECDFMVAGGLRAGGASGRVSNVEHLGRVDPMDMPGVYQRADVLLLPTLREGMSLATLEAMACGLPIVTTGLSSQPELVKHGKGGYTVPAEDVRGMAKALRRLAHEPSLRRDMGDFNRERITAAYDANRMAAEYHQLFDDIRG